MEYGVCGEPGIASILARAGYDYVELHVQRDLKTADDEDAFLPQLERLRTSPIPTAAANCFVPGNLKITGPEVDADALRQYVTIAIARARRAGIEVIVFGSGGARRIPEDYDRDAAWQQLLDFGHMVAPVAQEHEITVVVEPLNRRECNVLNTVGECAAYVRAIDHPNLRLLVDGYHWAVDQDSYEDLVVSMPLIQHVHIATYTSRMAPGLEPCDFGEFFRALKAGGYEGRVSIEGRWSRIQDDAESALIELRRSARAAGL